MRQAHLVAKGWRRRDRHPPSAAARYRRVLSAADFEDGLTETDLFFLTVRSLRTLPVGRNLMETLELSATPERLALRACVAVLNE